MTGRVTPPLDPDQYISTLEVKSKARLDTQKLQAGWFGKVYGSNHLTPVYIAGTALFVVLLVGLTCTLRMDDKTQVTDLWKILSPILTSILGFIFGTRISASSHRKN